jgi:serine protease
MKRLFSSISLALSLCLSATAPLLLVMRAANAQTNASATGRLYYNFGDQKISLSVQTDSIAVALKPARRNEGASAMSLLQQDFGGGGMKRRGGAKSQANIEVRPVDNKYALIVATADPQGGSKLRAQATGKSYIQETLPVLKIAGQSDSLILRNEVLIGIKSGTSASERQAIFAKSNFKEVKPLPFAPGFYLATPTSTENFGVLKVANTLSKIKGVDSAIPNFIQVKASAVDLLLNGEPNRNSSGIKMKSQQSSPIGKIGSDDFEALQWHIDSQKLRASMGLSGGRTDLRIPEAWRRSKKGDGVVVAVVDALIQWDHPALAGSIVTIDCSKQKDIPCLPGEEHGWDFSNLSGDGDNDTRVSPEEVSQLQPKLQAGMQSDEVLKENHADLYSRIAAKYPNHSEAQNSTILREVILGDALGSFHGTMCAGMIAGNGLNGFRGIAPNAKILPVRAAGLDGSFSPSSTIVSLGYAAVRGADVINMSFGGAAPNPGLRKMLADIRSQYPNTVLVAAAGNETNATMAYPAGYPGIVAVGSINLKGNRAPYSNFGKGLDVVAPGGDSEFEGGVLTLSGVGSNSFWADNPVPTRAFAPFQDNRGYYVLNQGTSFAAPAVVGVVALMKSADPQRKLTGLQYINILRSTSSRESLSLTPEESSAFAGTGKTGSPEEFFFATGLVNADKAVAEVEKLQQ